MSTFDYLVSTFVKYLFVKELFADQSERSLQNPGDVII